MTHFLQWLHDFVWGAPALILILSVGLYLTVSLGFVQVTRFPRAAAEFLAQLRPQKTREEGVTSFQALCTALAATVGTGNLVGVAGAICLGGPGAIFWMWICGILGMALKYGEAALAVRYRVRTAEGFLGGPMYGIIRGMGEKFRPLALAYCLFGVLASFGVGNGAQINSVLTGIHGVLSLFGIGRTKLGSLLLGLLLAGFLGRLLLRGAGGIGAAAERLVPLAAMGYVLLCLGVLVCRAEAIPGAFLAIVQGAFSPRAVTGGMLGSAFQALRVGCARGVFTNEAGMGTAAIAHAGAEGKTPAQQGRMGIMEVFLDTIVICTLTALVILVSGVPVPYGVDAGAELTTAAFASVYGGLAPVIMALFLSLFAIATVLGWSLYGGRCAQFLWGNGAWKPYVLVQSLVVVLSSVLDTASVWQISETLNGMMAIPNLILLAAMSPELRRLTKE